MSLGESGLMEGGFTSAYTKHTADVLRSPGGSSLIGLLFEVCLAFPCKIRRGRHVDTCTSERPYSAFE